MDIHIIKGDVLGVDEKVGPAWRIQLCDTLHRYTCRVVGQEQNRPVEGVGGVLPCQP